MSVRCAVCGRPAAPLAANPAFPFCSARCRLLDLGKWLGGEYRIPGAPAGEGEAGPEDGPDGEGGEGGRGPGMA